MSFTRLEIADACRRWGTHLWTPAGLDGVRILWALSGNESSFGANLDPRHEDIYCTGKYSKNPDIVRLTAKFGHAAHSSWGPWQIMLSNCSPDTSPQDMASLDRSALETVTFINRRIFKYEKAATLEAIADAYNSGDWRDRIVPEKYIADFLHYYNDVPLPR
jgi:hypothetical protein